MADVKFKSTLTDDEIKNNFKDIDFFSGIMSGLEEALAYEKGNATVHCLGNGRVCIYGRGADIFQAFGPDYSAPECFTASVGGEFVTKKVSYRQYEHVSEKCVIVDYLPEDESVFYRAVKGGASVRFEIKNAALQDTPYKDTYIAITYEGAPVYIYDFYKDGRPKAYTSSKKRYAAVKIHGDAELKRVSDTAFTVVCRDCVIAVAFSHTPEEVFDLISKPVPAFTLPERQISVNRYYHEVCDGYDAVASQQSYNGSVLAGYNYHLCYVRDNYGVLRFLLACGANGRAKLLLEFYLSVFEKYGKLHNAQGMTEYAFHVHENDKVEITGYIVLMFAVYFEKTGDYDLLRRALPLIEFCVRCQHEAMVGDVLPFNGDETYVAGGFMPRSALNDGSAEATALYHQSTQKLLSLEKTIKIPSKLKENVLSDAAVIEKNYLNNFIKDGVLYANKPGIGYKPDFRHGVRACGHGFGLCFRNENNDYVCPDCVNKKTPRFYGDEYGKRYVTEAAVLCPAFTGTALIPKEIIKATAQKVIAGFEKRTDIVGYEPGLLLYASGYNEKVVSKMLSMRDKYGVWSEYFRSGKQAGTLCRTCETSVNLAALLDN